MSKPALWARPLGLTRRPFSSSPFLSLPRPTQPSRPPPSSGLPPPLPRTPIGRITPLRVPASSLPPTTPTPEQDEQEAERALLRRTFETTDFAQLKPTIWRPVLWSILVSGSLLTAAAYLTNEDTELYADKLGAGSFWRRTSVPSQKEMVDAKRLELMKDLQTSLESLQKTLSPLPTPVSSFLLRTYLPLAEGYLNASEAQRFAFFAISVNALVFLGWKSKRVRVEEWMKRGWTHSPISGKSYTLASSTFSHAEFWHFGFNMFALWSFTPMAFSFLVHGDRACLPSFPSLSSLPESTTIYHLAAFYLSAGIFASLASHLHVNLFTLPRFLSALRSLPSTTTNPTTIWKLARQANLNGSLGASGALYALLSICTLSFPQASLGIILIPFVSFPITWGFGALCLLDLVGVWKGWKAFNHVAHLGGAVFGAVYWRYGCDLWNGLRSLVRRPPPATARSSIAIA